LGSFCRNPVFLRSITSIDAGNTLVIEFEDAGGETVKILVPPEEVATFNEKLAAAVSEAGE
jgi:hypothetical protein